MSVVRLRLEGTIATSNDAIVLGAVTLGSATTIDTNASQAITVTSLLQRLLAATNNANTLYR